MSYVVTLRTWRLPRRPHAASSSGSDQKPRSFLAVSLWSFNVFQSWIHRWPRWGVKQHTRFSWNEAKLLAKMDGRATSKRPDCEPLWTSNIVIHRLFSWLFHLWGSHREFEGQRFEVIQNSFDILLLIVLICFDPQNRCRRQPWMCVTSSKIWGEMTRALWALKLRVQNAKKCNQLRRSQEEQTSGERSTSDRATVASLGSTGGIEGNAAKHGLNSYLKKEVKVFSHGCMNNYEYIRLRFLSLCFLFCHKLHLQLVVLGAKCCLLAGQKPGRPVWFGPTTRGANSLCFNAVYRVHPFGTGLGCEHQSLRFFWTLGFVHEDREDC